MCYNGVTVNYGMEFSMRFARQLIIVALCVIIALPPEWAEARAGSRSSRSGGSSHQSMGSRGAKTYDNKVGKPIERSMAPKPAPAPQTANPVPPPASAPAPMAPPLAQPSFFQRHPILAGVMGGLAGSFIGNMLFNHSRGEARDNDWDSPDASPAGRSLGAMLPFVFIIGLILLGIWLYRRKTAHMAQPMMSTGYNTMPSHHDNWASSSSAAVAPATTALSVGEKDFLEFAELLITIQYAWGLGDLAKIQRLVTPEMLGYFSEILAGNVSQGIRNQIQQVKVLNQTPRDAWEEDNMQYATSLLTWSAMDYTVSLDKKPGDPGYLVEGDMQNPVEVAEVWTFARSRKGGNWLLSAIQQI